jgi:hypothetical protein
MFARIVCALLLMSGIAACSKVPESEEAKKIGNIPKQTIDRAQTNIDNAMQAAGERNRQAEKKEE